MAIKRKRKIPVDDINFRLAEVATKGQLVTYDTSNDGYVRVPASVAFDDKVAGLLMIDVVDKDFNAVPENRQRLETGLSGVVRLAKVGEIATNRVAAGAVFGPGSGVYLADGGLITNVSTNEQVGTALAEEDADGFVEIYLDID
jgi:hypothetical protein